MNLNVKTIDNTLGIQLINYSEEQYLTSNMMNNIFITNAEKASFIAIPINLL